MEPTSVTERKDALRSRLKRSRRLMPREERERVDAAITERLLALPAYERADTVLTYLSFGSEVDTHALVERAWSDGKLVVLPRCVEGTRQMEWYRVDSLDGLRRSRIGVLEPERDPARLWEVPHGEGAGRADGLLVVVPGLAFDAQGYRLGYGGGYYDSFLGGLDGTKVGLCRLAQFRRSLQQEGVVEDHDLAVDMVVTEGGVIGL